MPYRCINPLTVEAIKNILDQTQRLHGVGRIELHVTQGNGSVQVMPGEWIKQVRELAMEALEKRPEAQ